MIKQTLTYDFSPEKNRHLKATRGVCFEEIITAIQNDQILDIIKHPNQENYPHQKMYVVLLNEYVYLVPFVEQDNVIFLKTIIPSRKAMRDYFGGAK